VDESGALLFVPTKEFDRDMKRMVRRGLDIDRLEWTIGQLLHGELLPRSMRDHALFGEYLGFRECHVRPDWLFIYRLEGRKLIAARTGSHADLFG